MFPALAESRFGPPCPVSGFGDNKTPKNSLPSPEPYAQSAETYMSDWNRPISGDVANEKWSSCHIKVGHKRWTLGQFSPAKEQMECVYGRVKENGDEENVRSSV